ncbi:unnamed protein product [Rhizophagus irregularis]|nr:unnamed protein product [Rhizophagus irregularis]
MASTSGSSYDVNTDIDGYDMEDDDRLPETEPNQDMNDEKLADDDQEITIEKNGSTSTLIKHLKNEHNNIIAAEKKVGAMDKFVKKADELKFTQDNWRNDLIKWVVVNDQPFTVVDDDHFKVMIKRLNREAIIPSAVTIHKDIHQAFNDKQTSIQKELQNF